MRQYVATKVTAAELQAVNDYLVDLFGDDPDSEEITLNAYVDGADPSVATHSFSNMNTSAADALSIASELVSHAGCDSRHRNYTSGSYSWDDARMIWNLRPIVPMTP
jgi:hypothetical protein